ncbi:MULTISPECIES: hypothetical protein [unclassified Flavobacterium]|uniref:hypothetical protein n=1 Tax=unclassified Flavobacterium TaxID=196869 RepID=UPI00131D4AE0|nr:MULTISPECIES: hypothetical protein [unclassified Flavobacterium]
MKTDLKEVSKKIKELIDYEVSKIERSENKWKNQYDSVISELESELRQINEVVEDFTDSKLTLNCIEMEGYKRCLTTMINRFRDFEKYE